MTERNEPESLACVAGFERGSAVGAYLLFFSVLLCDDVGSLSVLSWMKNEYLNLRGVVRLKELCFIPVITFGLKRIFFCSRVT